jgi:hypothetical protein
MPSHFFEYGSVEWRRRANEEHGMIVEALRDRDGDRAAMAVAAHYRTTGEQAVEICRATGYWDAELKGGALHRRRVKEAPLCGSPLSRTQSSTP